ncbi:MAG: bacillithiol biosynthesis cysteine-adding enzyme BshC [Bacteroidota bacterium]
MRLSVYSILRKDIIVRQGVTLRLNMNNAPTSFSYVPYKETGFFSHLVNDYLEGHPELSNFYTHTPDEAGLAAAIDERANYPVDRKLLVNTLTAQYEQLNKYGNTEQNIQLLLSENTFTVCTAHQPNLMTGYLYFVHKILHAIKLAEELNAKYPDKHFVPVYYMGSEDNDLEELGKFRFRGDKYVWDGDGQKGAVGRMNTAGLKKMLAGLFRMFGPPGKNCDDLQQIISEAYLEHKTIGSATQYLVNELFGRYGLVILDPDDTGLKSQFVNVMEDELLHQHALPILTEQINALGKQYQIQAHPRGINLFYLNDQLRERIEKHGERWVVLNTDITWTKEDLLAELQQHPERFSPNVMLRGLFQETILPDVAFIGGGAEVAYWLQLKTLFAHYGVFYPAILLRQSVQVINGQQAKQRQQAGLSIADIFKSEEELIKEYIATHGDNKWQTGEEEKALANIFAQLKEKATTLDPTLTAATEAVLTKMKYQLAVLEKKMLRAEKRKLEIPLERLRRLKASLFPNHSLQERTDNFMDYYLDMGPEFFNTVKDGILPLGKEFLVIEQQY